MDVFWKETKQQTGKWEENGGGGTDAANGNGERKKNLKGCQQENEAQVAAVRVVF